MIGDRIARVARRLVCETTYDAMVAPAIADLQHEARCGWRGALRGYAGAWRAIAGATLDETARDTVSAFAGLISRKALKPAWWTLLLVTAAWMGPIASMIWDYPTSRWPLASLLLPSILPLAVLPALAMAAHVVASRTSRVRGFVVAGACAGLVLLTFIDQGVTRVNQAFRNVAAASIGVEHPGAGARELTLAELNRWPDLTFRISGDVDEVEVVREGHRRVAFAASCIAYALFGIALCRMRPWKVAAIIATVNVVHVIGATPDMLHGTSDGLAMVVATAWLPTAALTTIAATSVYVSRAYVQRR